MVYFGKRSVKYCYVDVSGLPWWKALLRVLVALPPVIVICLPFLLVPVDSMNIYVCMFFKSMLPTLAFGFFIFCGALEWMYLKLNLIKIKEMPQEAYAGSVTLQRASPGNADSHDEDMA